MAQTLIQVKDLKKYYNGGDVKALDGVTVDVYKGARRWTSPSIGRKWAWCSSTSTCSPTKRCWRI